MITTKKKHVLSLMLVVAVPIVIIIALLLFPGLLQVESSLLPIQFITAGQSSDRNTFCLQGSFERELPEHETLWFYAENAEVELHVAGQTFRCNERRNTPAMFRSPGSGWYAFDSPGIAKGETAVFVVRSYYGENDRAAAVLLANLHTGDGEGPIRLMLRKIDFFGIVLLFATLAGIVFILEGTIDILFGVAAEGMRIALFGFYCFAGGLWCMTDLMYPYITLLLSPSWAAAFLDAAGLLLFPIALAMLIRYYMRGTRTKRILNIILLSEVLLAAVCLSLQFFGKADLIEQQLMIGMVALPSICVAMVCIVLELRKYRDNYLLLLFLTVLPVFVSNLVDGINLFYPFMPRRTLMQYSFAISILLLLSQLVSYARVEFAKAEAVRRMEQELTDSRITVMLSQIQPHFLYNSLQGIKRLCDVEPKHASKALEHFAYYLRGNLYSLSNLSLIPFSKEIDHVENYLYLEKMRFEERVNVVWEIGFTDFLIPSLSLQPIVENAVRHGLTKKEFGGTITIKSEELKDAILITVTDDGAGFDTTAAPDTSRPHVGIENVRKRLETQCSGTLQIQSETGVGTDVKITLPKEGSI